MNTNFGGFSENGGRRVSVFPMRLLFLLLFIVFAAAAARAAERINSIVAVVNNSSITELEVSEEAKRLQYGNNMDIQTARRRALESLINRRLQLQRADLYRGEKVPENVINEHLADLRREFGVNSDEEMRAYVKDRFFMSYPKFIQRVEEDIRIRSLFYQELYSRTQVYDEEVEQYLQTETSAGERRQYRLAHILVAKSGATDVATQQALANELRARAAAGEDFAALAVQYSAGEQAATGGDLGFKYEEDLPQAFLETALGLDVAAVGEVIESSRGFHILKLTDKRGGELRGEVGRVRLRHISLPADGEATAQQVYRQIRDGKLSFKDAVRDYSTDQFSKSKDGDLGWFSDNDLSPYFSTAIKGVAVGEIGAPIRSPYGWHIVQLDERRTDQLDMEFMRDRARRVLRERRARAQREIWLQELRGEAYINIYSPEFASLFPQ